MSRKLLLIMNPYSGQKVGKRHLVDILELFCKADYIPTTFMTTGPGNGRQVAAQHAAQHDLVVCLGGDGTFNEVVCGVLDSGADTPIGYIPCGSTNDFAGSVGLNKNLLKAAQDILDGSPHTLDVGLFGQRHFTYVASFGAFTRASYATPQNTKNVLGHLAYILEGIKDIPSLRAHHLRVETPQQVFEGDYIFGGICNSTSVAGILTLDPNIVDMNDGLLELLLIKMPKNALELEECIRALQKQNYTSPMLTLHSADRMTVYADPAMPWTLDGEREEGHDRVEVRNLHNAIRLIVKDKKRSKSKEMPH